MSISLINKSLFGQAYTKEDKKDASLGEKLCLMDRVQTHVLSNGIILKGKISVDQNQKWHIKGTAELQTGSCALINLDGGFSWDRTHFWFEKGIMVIVDKSKKQETVFENSTLRINKKKGHYFMHKGKLTIPGILVREGVFFDCVDIGYDAVLGKGKEEDLKTGLLKEGVFSINKLSMTYFLKQGKQTFPNGTIWEGTFEQSAIAGLAIKSFLRKGKKILPSGLTYEGTFNEKGNLEGPNCTISNGRISFTATFKDGKMIGGGKGGFSAEALSEMTEEDRHFLWCCAHSDNFEAPVSS